MKKKTQTALTLIFAAVVLLIVFLTVTLNALVDKNRENIRLEIQRHLGRNLSFKNVTLDLWAGPGLSATDLRIADDPRFAATPLIQTKELKMQVRWLPLLLGKVEIKTLILSEPEFQIIKNEEGKFNIFATPEPGPTGTESRPRPTAKRSFSLSFPVSGLKINGGSIHYVDRSTKEPVVLRLYNLDLNLSAVGPSREADIELSANFLNGNEPNVRLKGQLGPLQSVKNWNRSPVNLQVLIEALPFPKLTSAIPILRERIPSYLNINGPLALETRVTGTLGQPHMTGLTLTGAFFGSSTNNVKLTADLDMSQGLQEQASIKGEVIVESVLLERLREIPIVERMLPSALTAKGPLVLFGEINGNAQEFQVYASLDGAGSEIAYGKWLTKPKGIPAKVEIRATRKEGRISLYNSTFTIHNAKVGFSGLLEEKPERLLRLQLQTEFLDISGWDQFLIPVSDYDMAGKVRLDLSIQKTFSPQRHDWNLQGFVTLNDLRLQKKGSKSAVEGITSQITFLGQEARVDKLQFRVGATEFTLQGNLRDLAKPTVRYRLSSPRVNLSDFTSLPEYKADWIRNLSSEGSFQFTSTTTTMNAGFRLAEGQLQELPYRNLQGQILWDSKQLTVKEFAFEALGGNFKGQGVWEKENDQWSRFTFYSKVEGVDMKELLPRLSPEFPDGFEGKLNFEAKLKGWGENWETIQKTLVGQGQAEVKNGALRDVNLIRRVLSRVTGLPGVGSLTSSSLSSRYGSIFKRQNTPYDTMTASFQVEEGRFRTRDFFLTAEDYSIRAEGWIGFDSSMGWDADLSLSRPLTRELTRSHKNIRYLANKKGRLAVPFGLTGSLPRMEPKPNLKRLAGLIQEGLNQATKEEATKARKTEAK